LVALLELILEDEFYFNTLTSAFSTVKSDPMDQQPNLPPLASIDEADDEFNSSVSTSPVDYVDCSNNKNSLLLLSRARILPPPSSTSTIHPPSSMTILSPASDFCTSGLLTCADEELPDTGFFSSSALSCGSSKRSSIDFNSSPFHQNVFDHLMEDELIKGTTTVATTPGEDLNLVESPNLSGSLEDLVNSFDEKVKSCLHNYDENVARLAPVQMRSADEVLKDRP